MWKWETEGQAKAVVVIIHGAYENHLRYAWLIEKFRKSSFHVVAGDLPGHGKEYSNKPHDADFSDYDTYVKTLLHIGLQYELPLFILGHGLGATLLMKQMQEQELVCAGVILSSPWLQLIYSPPKFSMALATLGRGSNAKINHSIGPRLLTRNLDIHSSEDSRDYNSTITVGWYRDLLAYMKSVVSYAGPIKDVPVLMHVGQRDKITDTDIAKQWIVSSDLSEFQYKQWKNCYHDLYREPEQEEIFLYTEDFIHNVLRSIGYIV